MILVRHCTVLSILYTTPRLIQDVEFSFTTERTDKLPSRFFVPATPIILDEPNSIATINSFAITIIAYRFYFFSYRLFDYQTLN